MVLGICANFDGLRRFVTSLFKLSLFGDIINGIGHLQHLNSGALYTI